MLAHASEYIAIPERAADTAAVKELQTILRGEGEDTTRLSGPLPLSLYIAPLPPRLSISI